MLGQKTILLVEDDDANRESVAIILEREQYSVLKARDGLEALELLRKNSVDLVLTDLKMPALDGMDLLKSIKLIQPHVDVVLMTAHATIETAVEAIKKGAYDFVPKPFKKADLLRTLEKCLEHHSLVAENVRLKSELNQYRDEKKFLGRSLAATHLLDMIKKVSQSSSTVLLLGESGTGKEVLADMIHQQSLRNTGPLIKISCAALPETLLEAELFGYEKGAFTGANLRHIGRFEAAHQGTLFLDEIGEISLSTQVKLLRVLQEGEFERLGSSQTLKCDVRVVAATNRNLDEAVKEKKFREDLFYRLNVISIAVPPLRSRKEDIPLLAEHFLKKFSAQQHKPLHLSAQAKKLLEHYSWPGNVRELENTLERAAVLAKSDTLTPDDFPLTLTQAPKLEHDVFHIPFGTSLEDLELKVIQATLEKTQGDKNLAAKMLGINVRTIYRKLNLE